MAATQRQRATCAHCGVRDATAYDKLENGTLVPSCDGCMAAAADPPPPVTTGERVFNMVRMSPGADVNELALAMGEDDELGRARISAALSRAVRCGLIRAEGQRCERLYYPIAGARWR